MKATVVALARALANEVAGSGIRVDAALPGDVDTTMRQWALHVDSDVTGTPYPEVLVALSERVAPGRLAVPAEAARLVALMASDEARFIAGQACIVNGSRALP